MYPVFRVCPLLRSLAAVAVVVCGVPYSATRADPQIVMVTSDDTPPYQQVLEGVRTYLAEHEIRSPLTSHSFQVDPEQATQALAAARKGGKVPVLTVGSVATHAALGVQGDAPVIACMIVNGQDLKDAPNATGVTLDFPLEIQFRWLKRFVPRTRTVGVLYSPEENRAHIEAAARVARNIGLTLVAREVARPQALPAALASLAQEADVLWGVTDQLVLSPQTGEAILLFSFRNRIPFTGLSGSWVKAGALYALDRDYRDIGAQCAEMLVSVLGGTAPSALPPAKPRKLTYALNLRTAEYMKLEIPEALIEGASEVFR